MLKPAQDLLGRLLRAVVWGAEAHVKGLRCGQVLACLQGLELAKLGQLDVCITNRGQLVDVRLGGREQTERRKTNNKQKGTLAFFLHPHLQTKKERGGRGKDCLKEIKRCILLGLAVPHDDESKRPPDGDTNLEISQKKKEKDEQIQDEQQIYEHHHPLRREEIVTCSAGAVWDRFREGSCCGFWEFMSWLFQERNKM